MHRSEKPVRKCGGCGLNFRDHCGVYDSPHDQWHNHRRCPGYMNEKMLAEYEAHAAARQQNKRKKKRREVAQIRKSATHMDGDRHVIMGGHG